MQDCKQTEIWLIDKVMKGQSLEKTQTIFMTFWLLERTFGVAKDPSGLLCKVHI